MTAPRTICVVTGSRAEYGLLQFLMKEIQSDAALTLQVIATGMHLSPEFGLTYRDIEADGFAIDARVEMLLSSDSAAGIATSIGIGTAGCAAAFDRLRPDIVVLLGDRFECLAAAQAALIARLPIAHLHGGEVTEGAVDEAIRHAITKMAQWHFVAAEPYRKRVIQLGEDPARVFDVGSPGLDRLDTVEWLERAALEQALGMPLKTPLFLVTYHPSTLGDQPPERAMDALLASLDAFPEAGVILTYPNADAGGRVIIERLEQWTARNRERAAGFVSLGTHRYLNAMRACDVVIGNSSSGLIEAPALGTATVNIGERQTGRLKATSVIDAAETQPAITAAITRALSGEFRQALPSTVSLYGRSGASRRIKDILKSVTLETRKPFFDVGHTH